jgi:hypothetical protein
MTLSSLRLTGIILWWAEGTKSRLDKRWKTARSYPVELTNTNPAIIKIFVDFLRKELLVPNEKLRVQIQIHDGDNQIQLEDYWSNITGVPLEHFNKTIVRPVGKKIGKSRGTCKVRFADKQIYLKLERLLKIALEDIYENPNQVLETLPHYEFLPQSVKISQSDK